MAFEPPEERRAPAHEGTAAFLVATGTGGTSRRPGRRRIGGRRSLIAAAAGAAGVGLTLGFLLSRGRVLPALRAVGSFLDFYCGVFALVALSLTVMIGLLATDRAMLAPRHRVRAQAVHRATAFAAVTMLALHLASQVARHRIGVAQAFLPHSGHHLTDYGLGTLAAYLLIIAVAGGIARGRFAGARHPWAWRATHLTAYAAWPLGVLHGLTSGRTPATWVTVGYLLCLAGVVLALAARPVLRPRERRAS
ncbi:hypothetical protein [Actinomadura macra]|uniref:hypothetical protein n=1 Tax=Actinomadura macra TaxID=46164 RepID=UPI0008348EAB|nr:hypothetical protein [Actinomadura macra]